MPKAQFVPKRKSPGLFMRIVTKPMRVWGPRSQETTAAPRRTSAPEKSKQEAFAAVVDHEESLHGLSHVRHDPGHCLAPGLFQSLAKNNRRKGGFEAIYDYGQGKRIEFHGPKQLGVDDLRVLQGLIAMAGPSGRVLSLEPKTERGKQLRESLKIKWDAVQEDAIVVDDSYRTLAREIGYSNDGGSQIRSMQESLERLWMVSVIAQDGSSRRGFHLLAAYSSDEHSGKLCVALNPMIARAIMGGSKHVRISMTEVRALRSDAARLIHQRLCAWIDPQKAGKVSLDIMTGYVWPDAASPSTMRKRRQRAREALVELESIGWKTTQYARFKYEIVRPSAKS